MIEYPLRLHFITVTTRSKMSIVFDISGRKLLYIYINGWIYIYINIYCHLWQYLAVLFAHLSFLLIHCLIFYHDTYRAESKKIFVGGLSTEVTEKDFADYFGTFGVVKVIFWCCLYIHCHFKEKWDLNFIFKLWEIDRWK